MDYRGGSVMDNKIVIKLFIERVASGAMMIEQVPEIYKAQVQELLNEQTHDNT